MEKGGGWKVSIDSISQCTVIAVNLDAGDTDDADEADEADDADDAEAVEAAADSVRWLSAELKISQQANGQLNSKERNEG